MNVHFQGAAQGADGRARHELQHVPQKAEIEFGAFGKVESLAKTSGKLGLGKLGLPFQEFTCRIQVRKLEPALVVRKKVHGLGLRAPDLEDLEPFIGINIAEEIGKKLPALYAWSRRAANGRLA
jgi:hypothetical protein